MMGAARGLTGSASPTTASGSRSGAGSVTTGSVTATPSGGTGTITYSWSCTGGFTANSPTSAATTFSTTLTNGGSGSGVASCTMVDALGSPFVVTVALTATSTYLAPLTVTIPDGNINTHGSGPGAGPFSHTYYLLSSGGVGSITVAWSLFNTGGSSVHFTSGTTATTVGIAWTNPSSYPGGNPSYAILSVTITDAANGNTASASVEIDS